MNKQNLLEKLLTRLKGGDDAKLSRFVDKLEKFYKNQIKMRNDSIEKLQEKIDDVEENLKEAIESVDVDAINKTDGADGYCKTYHNKIDRLVTEIEEYQDEIETLKKEIAKFESIQSKIDNVGPAVK